MSGSFKELLKPILIFGSASAVSVVLGIVRLKVIALLFGAAGIGFWSILSNFLNMVSTAFGLGLSTSGVKQISAHQDDAHDIAQMRTTLSFAIAAQSICAALLIYVMRAPLSQWMFGHPDNAAAIALTGVGAACAMLATSQSAILQGHRKISAISKATALAALAGTSLGIAVLYALGEQGIVIFILLQPLISFVMMAIFVIRALPKAPFKIDMRSFAQLWLTFARLGIPLMLGVLIMNASLLLVRRMLVDQGGLAAAGLFAASWTISTQYIGFLLNAMATDYFPRLSGTITDSEKTNTLVNKQTQLGLMIGLPVLFILIGAAPWFITLFYAQSFAPAVEILQWQSLGNILKITSWPLSFVLITRGQSKLYLATEILWNGCFVSLVWFGLDAFGAIVTGYAFALCYVIYLAVLVAIMRTTGGPAFDRLSLRLITVGSALGIAVIIAARYADLLGLALAVICSLGIAAWAFRILFAKDGP